VNTLPAPLRHTSQVQIFSLPLCSSQTVAPLSDTVHRRLYYFFPLLCKTDRFTVFAVLLGSPYHSLSQKKVTFQHLSQGLHWSFMFKAARRNSCKEKRKIPCTSCIIVTVILRRCLCKTKINFLSLNKDSKQLLILESPSMWATLLFGRTRNCMLW